MWESVQTVMKPPIQSRKFKLSCSLIAVTYCPSRLKLLKKIVAKFPSFSHTFNRKNKKKKTKCSKHKKVKKARRRGEYSSDSSSSSSEEDRRHTREHSGGSLPYFTPLYSFPGQPQGYQCHSFINPYNLIRKRAEFNKDFSWPILITTLCKIRICVTMCRLESQT